MTHHDAGNYRKKHPPETSLEPGIARALKAHASDGTVSCAVAHGIAAELGLPAEQIGVAMDLMELRITKCQLGLFGYYPEKKIVKPASDIASSLEKSIKHVTASGKLSCADAWAIAKVHGIKKMALSSAIEKLGYKVSPCQLGAF